MDTMLAQVVGYEDIRYTLTRGFFLPRRESIRPIEDVAHAAGFSHVLEMICSMRRAPQIAREVGYFHMYAGFNYETAIQLIAEKTGARLATTEEIVYFALAYPDEQWKYPIVALGQPLSSDLFPRAGVQLSVDHGIRCIYIAPFSFIKCPYTRVLIAFE